jgi:acetylornithine/succinyldiaminopimelate/putrescine aminotransferase
VIQAIEDGELCARAMRLGEQFRGVCWPGKDRFPLIRDVRGLGAMQAFELADAASTKALTKYCYEHGLILVTAGTYGNVMRILMPLVVTDEQMDEALDVMEAGRVSEIGRHHRLKPAYATMLGVFWSNASANPQRRRPAPGGLSDRGASRR